MDRIQTPARVADLMRSAGRLALDLALPPRCLGCGAEVGADVGLCARCWRGLSFIAAPLCDRCGRPFDFADASMLVCGACIAAPPLFARARTVVAYDEASKGMILAFKHADRTDAAPTFAAPTFAAWMARAGAELLDAADLIAPVPLHRWRLWARRYNQSALIAHALGRITGRAVVPDLLARRRRTPTQGGLSRAGRRRNVEGAFAVPPSHRDGLAGRRVLLIDDVMTTGATVGECTRVLLRAGAAAVDVLTLARVVRAETPA